jgi:hypothetical protein
MPDQAKSGVSKITDQLVSEFENYLKQLDPKAFQQRFEADDEDSTPISQIVGGTYFCQEVG